LVELFDPVFSALLTKEGDTVAHPENWIVTTVINKTRLPDRRKHRLKRLAILSMQFQDDVDKTAKPLGPLLVKTYLKTNIANYSGNHRVSKGFPIHKHEYAAGAIDITLLNKT
jgi:hypothetical protein